MDAKTQVVSRYAGQYYNNSMLVDNVPATVATISGVSSMWISSIGDLYFTDTFNLLRKIEIKVLM